METSKHVVPKEKEGITGLVCFGSSGNWDVAIDESLSAPLRYYAQIEGPFAYLYFEIATVDFLKQALDFFAGGSQMTQAKHLADNAILKIAKSGDIQLSFRRDDEFNDRYFFVLEGKSGLHMRLTVTDDDLAQIAQAFRSALVDLEDAD